MEYGKKIRVGNYFLLKYKKSGFTFIKVGDIGGVFGFEVREDSQMYHLYDEVDMDIEGNELRAIHSVIENAFGAITLVDVEFQHDVRVAITEYLKRVKHSDIDLEKEKEYLEEEKLVNSIENDKE